VVKEVAKSGTNKENDEENDGDKENENTLDSGSKPKRVCNRKSRNPKKRKASEDQTAQPCEGRFETLLEEYFEKCIIMMNNGIFLCHR
jgi:hypothetical protein